jgi:uncharacterized protein YgfB (UPF0149 family)
MEQAIDHKELDDSLRRCGSSWNAGQAHGLLCSRLSVAGVDGGAAWISQLLADTSPDNDLVYECQAMLDALFALTWRQLAGRQSDFELLLPDDADPASDRAAAMASWCEGFLHGLVADKHSERLRRRLAAEPLADIIKDMLQISRAVAADDADDEDTERAYAELVEYLRIAVQITYEELADFRTPAEDMPPDDSETLH